MVRAVEGVLMQVPRLANVIVLREAAASSGSYTPDAGPGTYSFRARTRKPSVNKKTTWSTTASINVS